MSDEITTRGVRCACGVVAPLRHTTFEYVGDDYLTTKVGHRWDPPEGWTPNPRPGEREVFWRCQTCSGAT